MRIGIDISQSVYTGTGVASYTQNLIRALLLSETDEYVLFGSTLRRQKELQMVISNLPLASATIKTSFLPAALLAHLWNSWHIFSVEKFIGQVDVFHTSDWTEPPSQCPKVTTIHDLMVYKYPEHLPDKIVKTHKERLHWVKKESAAVIADSQSTKEDIIEYLKIPEKKIHVIHLGVSEEFYRKSVDEINRVKRKYKIKNKYILSVGTREPRKNLQRTIDAFASLKNDSHELVIAGNYGWGEETKLFQNVKILGIVDQIDLPALYSGATCFVYPSLYEGFGLPVLESMKCQTLVVTSNRGSLSEIVGKQATMVDPESVTSIAKGIGDILELSTIKQKELKNSALAHARSFTWEKTAQKTRAVYNSLV